MLHATKELEAFLMSLNKLCDAYDTKPADSRPREIRITKRQADLVKQDFQNSLKYPAVHCREIEYYGGKPMYRGYELVPQHLPRSPKPTQETV